VAEAVATKFSAALLNDLAGYRFDLRVRQAVFVAGGKGEGTVLLTQTTF